MSKNNGGYSGKNSNRIANNKKSKGGGFKPSMRGKQGRKDSDSKRINLDNARISTVERDIENDSKKSNNNDISLWNQNPEFMKSAGSIPFATILGDKYGIEGNTVPGIMTFVYSPTLGSDEDPVAFNKAFEAMYSFITHANSRNYKYDFPDIAMYCMGGVEVFAAIHEAMRVYGLFKSYREANRYLVDDLIAAMGWDPSDLRINLGQMWYDLNDLIMQTRQIWIPNVIPMLKRRMDMNSEVYTDAPGNRAQIYVFIRNRYWTVSETASNQGTCLVPASYNVNASRTNAQLDPQWCEFSRTHQYSGSSQGNTNLITWVQFRSMIQQMIDNLIASGDRGTIYGDLLAAYGQDKIYALPSFSNDYIVIPQYNSEVLMQIENLVPSRCEQKFILQSQIGRLQMTPIWYWSNKEPDAATTSKPTNTAVISGKVNVKRVSDGAPSTQILNMHFDAQPTPESVMIATRFKAGAMTAFKSLIDATAVYDSTIGQFTEIRTSTNAQLICAPSSIGTEIIVDVRVTTRDGSTQLTPRQITSIFTIKNFAAVTLPLTDHLQFMAFDWHPFIYNVDQDWLVDSGDNYITTHPRYQMKRAFGDFDNYVELSDINLKKLHHVAVFSALGVSNLL